ncbi:hypothetical protein E2C01_077601 [Portunus trituberculatus]|uniref:Uncharacterized protein n=1 Tax=Portunus trituberculatus TaxID=210409 RepID=A0A5B7IGF8_PORTR|nr:hypothetical protein [Portunus trituberculatus]
MTVMIRRVVIAVLVSLQMMILLQDRKGAWSLPVRTPVTVATPPKNTLVRR